MNASEITHSDTSWEDDKTATIGETEEMIPNKSASQEQPCDNLPDRTKAQINAVKQVFRKDDAIYLLIEDIPLGVDLTVRFHDDESLIATTLIDDVFSYVFQLTGTTNETFGVKFKEVGNDKVDIIDNINVEGTIVSAGLSSSGTQFLESHEDDEIPYDTLPVRRREFSKPCTDEVDVLHYQSDETETYNNTVADHLSNNLPTATKDDGLIHQHDIGTKTDVCVTSTEPLSTSTETLKADTLGSCSMSQNDSDTDFTMPLSFSAETLYAETLRSCLMSQGELEADLTITLSSQTKTFKVESLVDCSMAQNEFKADSKMPLNPSAETLKAEALARCSMPHSDADSTVHLSHLAETVTADTLSGYSTSQRKLDADSTMTLSPSAETLKAEPLVTCSTSQSELDADSTIDHDTVVPMQEKSPETDTKHHRLRCLLQDELARVNYAFRTTHYNDDNEVVLRSKARTSLQTDTERKTVYSIIEEELLLSDVDGHVLVADNEELSLSDADGHTLVADTMPLSLSDADVHALVADNEGSLRPCLIEEKEQQHDGEKDSLSAEGRSIDLPTDEILATSNTYEQEVVDQNTGKNSKKPGFSFKRQIKKIMHKSNSEPKMVAVVDALQRREKTTVCKSNSDSGTKEMSHAASTGGLFDKNEALQEDPSIEKHKTKGKGKKMTSSRVQRKPSVRIQRVLEDENIIAPALPMKPIEDT